MSSMIKSIIWGRAIVSIVCIVCATITTIYILSTHISHKEIEGEVYVFSAIFVVLLLCGAFLSVATIPNQTEPNQTERKIKQEQH